MRAPGATVLRGTLYVLGGTCAFIAANIMLPHDFRAWVAFGCGAVGNCCILWRAYLDRSHARFSARQPITDIEPAFPENRSL